ncbi:MAG: NAD-binding protein [Sulfurimonas sp.]
MFNKTKNRLVVIGAGYAGIELLKKVTKSNKFDIVLINDKSIHLHQTDIHKYLNGDIKDSSIAFHLNKFCEFVT